MDNIKSPAPDRIKTHELMMEGVSSTAMLQPLFVKYRVKTFLERFSEKNKNFTTKLFYKNFRFCSLRSLSGKSRAPLLPRLEARRVELSGVDVRQPRPGRSFCRVRRLHLGQVASRPRILLQRLRLGTHLPENRGRGESQHVFQNKVSRSN